MALVGNKEKEREGKGRSSEEPPTSNLHVSALDALVNVNSFFTGAVFIGLAFNTHNNGSSSSNNNGSNSGLVGQSPACAASASVARRLVLFEVLSFAFFMLSTLIAHGLKLQLALLSATKLATCPFVPVNERATRLGMLATAFATVAGTVFLTVSMVEVVELRLGLLSCPTSAWSKAAAYPLITCVFLGVSFLSANVLFAFFK